MAKTRTDGRTRGLAARIPWHHVVHLYPKGSVGFDNLHELYSARCTESKKPCPKPDDCAAKGRCCILFKKRWEKKDGAAK